MSDSNHGQNMYTPLEYLVSKKEGQMEERERIIEFLMKNAEANNSLLIGVMAIQIYAGEHLK